MFKFTLDIVLSILFLGIFETLIKPISINFTKRSIIKWTPLVLQEFDKVFPTLINSTNSVDLDKLVRDKFSELTGEDWSKINIDYFWQVYDLRVTLSKLTSLEDQV